VEHRQVDARQTTAYRSSGDDPARFLHELRQLRDGAGLGPAELAARAHYPYDRITAAEAGPALPDLPVLSAYVRGCGGTAEEWEERWRSLTSAPTLPLMAARPAGSSTAADAGARIGSISPAAETPDPSIILAALDRVAEGMAVGHPAPLWATGEADATGADVTGADVTAAEAPAAEAPGAGRDAVTPDWSAAAAPTAAETAPAAASAAPAVPPARAARAAALSPTTILVAIVVAICVLIVVLAIV
jgi:hypothetical protein